MFERGIISLFVIANGISIIAFPPVNHELQRYAIISSGIFTQYL